jgi:uncharacterized membrane-anchored protein
LRDPEFDSLDARPEFEPPASLAVAEIPMWSWLPGHERILIAAAVTFQLIVLAAIILRATLPTFGSPTVLLRVVPVDPRDLMRGDFVILSYDVNALPRSLQGPAGPVTADAWAGRDVYVTLVPEDDGRHSRAGAFLTEPPSSGRYIKGTVTGYHRASFGIEKFFVQEGKGHDYEQAVLRRKLSAEVALSASGAAALRRLVIE